MNDDYADIAKQIEALEKQIDTYADYLKAAFRYLNSDPQSSLTKCRIVLEKTLTSVYIKEIRKEPRKGMIGNILSDKEFTTKIPQSTRAKMNFIREIANLGPHGGEVEVEDAILVLRVTISVVQWYVSHCALSDTSGPENAQTIEVLARLKAYYANYLRPNIVSVKIGQTKDRCYLEITTRDSSGILYDETIKRTDLGFIIEGNYDNLFFKPTRNVNANAKKFIDEFNEIGIINCTDLFTEQAATMIYKYWEEHGKTPSGK